MLPFMVSCLFVMLIAAGIIMTDLSADPETKGFWFRFQYAWWLPTGTAVTCFVLEYAWPGRWLTRRNLILLSVFPLLGFFYYLADGFFHLLELNIQVGNTISIGFSPTSRIFTAYVLLLTLINFIVFTWLFIRSPQHRWPVILMTAGQVAIRLNLLSGSPRLDATFLNIPVIVLPYITYAVSLFGFRIFDPITLARQTAIDQLHAGMIVLDALQRVASLNPSAENILNTTTSQVRNCPARELLSACSEDLFEKPPGMETECHLGSRSYTLTLSQLKDFRGLVVGYLLMLRDITDQKLTQAQILEQQSALATLQARECLARDLHDDLAQTLAFLNVQAQASHELLVAQNTALADERLLRLAEVARQAHDQVRTLISDLRGAALAEVDFVQRLRAHLYEFGARHGLQTELIAAPDVALPAAFTAQIQEQVFHIVQEALTNIRKHARATHIKIHLAVLEEQVQVVVTDNGAGFNPGAGVDEKEHLGLRIMHERAAAAGGRLEIQSAPGLGTRVLIEIPETSQ